MNESKEIKSVGDSEQIPSRTFLSPGQLADRWACARTTAQRIAMRAGISKVFLGHGRNGMVRYPLEEIEAYERARTFRNKQA